MRRSGIVGCVVLAGLLVLGLAGCSSLPLGRSFQGSVLTIALGVDAEGTSVPAAAVAVSVETSVVARSVDPMTEVTVPGTSVKRLREAYPFAGGSGISEALAGVEGGEPIPYVVLSGERVVALLGEHGIEVDLSEPVAAYGSGALYRLPAGPHTYEGSELIALLASIDFVASADRSQVSNALAEGIAKALAENPGALAELLEMADVETDLSAAGLDAYVSAIEGAKGAFAFEPY